jgi:putative DNA-invertase from lambdoid prophage Rac
VTDPPRVALYARVSKGEDQTAENQALELREWAKRNPAGSTVPSPDGKDVWVDEVSSRDRRPVKELLLKRIRLGEIDTVVVVRLDRWGRSMDELVLELNEFVERRIAFVSLREGLRFDSAVGRMLANLLATFASFERDLIKERTLAGLRRSRSEGKIGGRHPTGCGCGAKPEGKPHHTGPVKPVRDGKRIVGWRYSDGREVPTKLNVPRPEGGLASGEAAPIPQTSVYPGMEEWATRSSAASSGKDVPPRCGSSTFGRSRFH